MWSDIKLAVEERTAEEDEDVPALQPPPIHFLDSSMPIVLLVVRNKLLQLYKLEEQIKPWCSQKDIYPP